MSTYSRIACLAWLASAGLSPSETEALLRENADPVSLYREWAGGKRPEAAQGISVRIQEALTHNSAAKWMDAWENVILKCGIQAVTFQDADYPDRLRPLGEAPAVLFYQGNLSAVSDGPAVSVVGSRSASSRGLEATEKITKKLSQAGIRIISGLAYGIDAAAHQGCLKGDSPTVAVLGCGLDQDYPAENAGLKREILAQGGAVISEYAPGDKPLGWHFPYRNRIISGLGDCVILMEARIRSGSMTTVQHALDQGKDVFLVVIPAAVKVRDRKGAELFGIASEDPGDKQEVQVGSDSQADGSPSNLGDTCQVGQAGQTHQQVTAHVGRLRAHGCDERSEASASDIEAVGSISRTLTVEDDADQQHTEQIYNNRGNYDYL